MPRKTLIGFFFLVLALAGCVQVGTEKQENFLTTPWNTSADITANQTITITHNQHYNEGTQSWWHIPDCTSITEQLNGLDPNIVVYQPLAINPWNTTTTTTQEIDSTDDLGNPIVSFVNSTSTSSGTDYVLPLTTGGDAPGDCVVLWTQNDQEPDANYFPTLAALQNLSGENQ